MESTTYAVDVAKSVFHVAVSRRPGRVAEDHRLSRAKFVRFFAERQPATVLLEACGSSHHWARHLQSLGHSVRLLPPLDVHRYAGRNKNDRADAKALLEASRNSEIHPVPVKTVDQQAVASLHRIRSAYFARRTAHINMARGLLREFGITIPKGSKNILPALARVLGDDDSPLPALIRPNIRCLADDIRGFGERIAEIDAQLTTLARQLPAARHLLGIPGIGVITATALIGCVGDIRRFPSARRFSSYLGLTPKEHSSGNTRRLGSISKKGDRYLRMLLMHGARSVLWSAKKKEHPDRLRAWALQVEARRGHNVATAALANRIARIVWAVWKNERNYEDRVY